MQTTPNPMSARLHPDTRQCRRPGLRNFLTRKRSKGKQVPAYVVSMMSIHDAETYKKYTDRTPPIVKQYGGRFLTRGEEVTCVEGQGL